MQNGDIVICQCIIILNRDTKSIILIGAKTIKYSRITLTKEVRYLSQENINKRNYTGCKKQNILCL